jgi:hypothetical protein
LVTFSVEWLQLTKKTHKERLCDLLDFVFGDGADPFIPLSSTTVTILSERGGANNGKSFFLKNLESLRLPIVKRV